MITILPIKTVSLTTRRGWTDSELDRLRAAYSGAATGRDIGLAELAKALGRDKANVCRKARDLGLTDPHRKKVEKPKVRARKFETDEEVRAHLSDARRRHIAEHGHPRGALGLRHTDAAKQAMAEATRKRWEGMTQQERDELVVKRIKVKRALGAPIANPRGTWKAAWREVGGRRIYFRSRWEANYARYLEWLKRIGQIVDWEHEPHTFWFDGIRRGVVSYLPDFRVTNPGGSIEWHEVKGWMDDRSRTTLKRMAKYHPGEKIVLIQEKQYAEIRRKVSTLVEGWEE